LGKNKKQDNIIDENLTSNLKTQSEEIEKLNTIVGTLKIEVERILEHLGMDPYQKEFRSRMDKPEDKNKIY